MLTRLEWQSDKEIAQALKLSYDGVCGTACAAFSRSSEHAAGSMPCTAPRARGILPAAKDAPEAEL